MRKLTSFFAKHSKEQSLPSSLSFQKWLILSYSFILLLVLIAGVFLYQLSYNQVKSGLDAQDQTLMATAIHRMDTCISSISDTARQLSDNSLFTSLTQCSDPDSHHLNYVAYHAQNNLKNSGILRQIHASDTFIYLKRSGYIISDTEFLPFDSYAKYYLFGGKDMADKIEEVFKMPEQRGTFIPLEKFDGHENRFLYFYPIANGHVFSEKYIQSYLCCIIDQDLISEYFSGLFEKNVSLTAKDSSGNTKFCFSKGNLNVKESNLISVSCKSDYNNWVYTLSQPSDQAYYSINQYRIIFTFIVGLCLVLGGAMIYYFTLISSRPIAKMEDELVTKEKQASSLHQLVEKNRPMVTESYMRRIMEGGVSTDDEMEYIQSELHLNRTGVKYHVLYIEVYPSEDYNIELDNMALCLQNYDVLVRDALKRYFPDTGYLYKPSSRIFAVLLAAPETLDFKQVMARETELFHQFHAELLNLYGIWSRGGFGQCNGKLSNTWKSYQQAKDARSITTAEHYIQSYTDYIGSNDIYYYPDIMAVQLTGAVSTGSRNQVSEIFHLIFKENTVNRTLSHKQHKQLLTDVHSTLFKKRYSLFPSENVNPGLSASHKETLDYIDKLLSEELNLKTLEQTALEMCSLCTQENTSNELIVKIQTYIMKNYHDPSLCLSKISDEFNISENYFSTLFKKETGENFSIYLEKLRMTNAKELVQHSDTSLSTLYQYLGYNNAASFRRVFKKTYGISPKEMREQNHE